MKKYFIYFIFVFLLFTPQVQASTLVNTGFIPGQIWYSKGNITEGDSVKIYTAVFNSGNSPLSAKVEFYDQNVILGTRDVSIGVSELKDVSVTWKVTAGDHLISAKIISPSITTDGKKESVSLENIVTIVDHKFIPILIKTIDGNTATSSEVLQSQIDKATSSISNIIPSSIGTPVSENIGVIDSFRTNTLKSILDTKDATEKKLNLINKVDDNLKTTTSFGKVSGSKVVAPQVKGIEQSTERPIAYIKLFFFKLLSFVFGNKLIFYLLILFVLFFIFRGIYRKIRNK